MRFGTLVPPFVARGRDQRASGTGPRFLVARSRQSYSRWEAMDLWLLRTEEAAYDGRYIWVSNNNSNDVSKIATGFHPQGVVLDGLNIWVANSGGSSLSRLLPRGTIGRSPVGV